MNKTYARFTDSELVIAFQTDNDERAYSELFRRYYHKVELYCLKSLGNEQSAQDATQDVFLNVFQKLHTLQQPKLWVAWLFRIVRNEVLNIHKKNAGNRMADPDELPMLAEDRSELEIRQEKERILAALPELLQTPDAQILKLKYLEGLSIEQLSQDLHLNESAVKMRLLRARHQLVQRYEESYASRA